MNTKMRITGISYGKITRLSSQSLREKQFPYVQQFWHHDDSLCIVTISLVDFGAKKIYSTVKSTIFASNVVE